MNTPQAKTGVEVEGLPMLPKVGPIGYASVVDIQGYAKNLTIGPHLPGIRDVALWTTDQMRAYATAALAAERAEAVRLAGENEKLRSALSDEKTAFYAGYGAAHDDINNSRAPAIQIAWDRRAALSPTQQGN